MIGTGTGQGVVCAICRQPIDLDARPLPLRFRGKQFYFCSHQHRIRFKKRPEWAAEAARDIAIPLEPPAHSGDPTRRGPFSILTEIPPDDLPESD